MRPEGFIGIDARMNDQPVILAVDTGAVFSMIDESLVKPLNLLPIRKEAPAIGSLIPEDVTGTMVGVGKIGAHKLRVVTVNRLQIGAGIWSNVHFGVANLKNWGISKPGSQGAGVQGLFGREMLAGHAALIDFGSGKLWLATEKKVAR